MDPTGGLGLFASILQVAKSTVDGVDAVRRSFPEYGRFWSQFERMLKGQHEVPWQSIRDRCRLDPEFVSAAIGLVHGDAEARSVLERELRSTLDGLNSSEEAFTRCVRAAEDAAALAARDEVTAGPTQRRLLEGRLANARQDVLDAIGEVRSDVRSIASVQDAANLRGHADSQLLRELHRVVVAAPFKQPRAELEATSPAGRHLAQLRQYDPDAADRLAATLGPEPAATVTAVLRDDRLEGEPPAALVAAGRIASDAGYFADAEGAYLSAARLEDTPHHRARQLVRASAMARQQGSDDRAERHLDAARRLAPDHPALRMADARRRTDAPTDMLASVADVEPESDGDRAHLHQIRAQAHLALDDPAAASRELELARAAEPESPAVREFEAILPWIEARKRIERREQPDRPAVGRAARRFEELAAEAVAGRRFDDAAGLTARAVEAYVLAYQITEAERLVATFRGGERLSSDEAVELAEAAAAVGRSDIALALIPEGANNPPGRLVRGEALAQSASAEDRQRGTAELRSLRNEGNEEIRKRAGFALLGASTVHEDVEWDEQAAGIVAEHRPDAERGLRAERLHVCGDIEGAERLMLRQASSVPSLRRLRDYAIEREQWDTVKDRSRELLRVEPDPHHRLTLAEALHRLGERGEAIREWLTVAHDASVEDRLRNSAYGSLTAAAGEDRDYRAVLNVAEEWHTALPDSDDALFNRLFGLARLSRHEDAYALISEGLPEADLPQRAILLAEILSRAAPPEVALREIAALSDRFDREIEALEGLLIGASLQNGAEDGSLASDLEERLRETFATFPERFPDSQVIQAYKVPETAEGIMQFLADAAGNRPALARDFGREILEGRAPVNALTAVSSDGIAETWARLSVLPLSYAIVEVDDQDRRTAAAALGSAAIWDSSSLHLCLRLGSEHADTVRGALPGSMIVTETLEDADADAPLSGRAWGETAHGDDGQVGVRELSADERDARRRRATDLLELARRFDVAPAMGPGVEDDLRSRYLGDDGKQVRSAFRALLGSVALAQRTRRPLFSEDRFVRELARRSGVPTFGTVALLDALAARGLVTEPERLAARGELIEAGGWGVCPTVEELATVGRATGFAAGDGLRRALSDVAAWQGRTLDTWSRVAGFLAVVHAEQPGQLEHWLQVAVEAAVEALPGVPRGWNPQALVMMSFALHESVPGGPNGTFFPEMVALVRRLPDELLAEDADPVLGAVGATLATFADESDETRKTIFAMLLQRLGVEDRQRALDAFASREDASAGEPEPGTEAADESP